MAKQGTRPGAIRIGCAGWSIGTPQSAWFGQGDSQLARYATRFDAVEVNSSFSRSHQPRTYARWAATVPPTFRFSVKLPRTITHAARLAGTGSLLDRLADEVAGLGEKLGGLLVQLPPSLGHDARVADRFFAMLRRRFDVPIACEPRHPDWFQPRVDVLWARYRIARVAADPARNEGAARPGGRGDWTYWRWHGSPRIYASRYGPERLARMLDAVRESAGSAGPSWCIFDNTARGHAVEDALALRAMLAGTGRGAGSGDAGTRQAPRNAKMAVSAPDDPRMPWT